MTIASGPPLWPRRSASSLVGVTLRDQLFPEGEAHRHDRLLQTEWSAGWADEFMGLGALTHWITPRLHELHAAMDYAGAAVVFLQRHRVELGLKALAHHAGGRAEGTHDLDALWSASEAALQPKDPDRWDVFASTHREFVGLVAQIDPGSYTFRYPVDKAGVPVKRPTFVDLTVFESLGVAFENDVEIWLYELEVSGDDHGEPVTAAANQRSDQRRCSKGVLP